MIEQQLRGVIVHGSSTRSASGAFEIINPTTRRVYFSKLNGDGFPDALYKLERLLKDLEEDGAVPAPNPPPIMGRQCSIM